jgi:cell division protein FtsX
MQANLLTSFGRVLASVFSGLWRARLSALFFSLALAFLFLFLHILSFGSLFSQEIIRNFEKKADIPIVINLGASDSQISAFRSALLKKKTDGLIVDFWELSRDKALEEFQQQYPEETGFIEKYNIPNPLTTVFGVVPSPKSGGTKSLEEWILSNVWHDTINQDRFRKSSELRDRVERFLHIASFSGKGIVFLQALFLSIALLLLFYSVFVLVRSHREEISVMRLVGARLLFIRAPFILEGVILSLIALFISVLLFWWFFAAFSHWIQNLLEGLGVSESFVTRFFENTAVFRGMLWDNFLLLLIFSFVAAVIGVEHALRKTPLSD